VNSPEETSPLGPSVRRVQEALDAAGAGHTVIALEQSARTSAEAARAVGCRVDQIAKSLVFRGEETQRPVLVIASGANRVDEVKVAALVAEPVGRADADFVRARTGFAIGGVAPVAHAEPLTILIDEDLMTWPEIWAAAGHPNTVFRLTPADLVRLTGGRVASVRTGGGRRPS
jgi:prolyl-tRNA editing enzyme YbaK/EbsC (Cys-tRNA(Pro) deacylase)